MEKKCMNCVYFLEDYEKPGLHRCGLKNIRANSDSCCEDFSPLHA